MPHFPLNNNEHKTLSSFPAIHIQRAEFRDTLLRSILTVAKDADELVRASALSNLAELAQVLRFAVGAVVHEVCLLNCIEREKLNSFECAIHVIISLAVVRVHKQLASSR